MAQGSRHRPFVSLKQRWNQQSSGVGRADRSQPAARILRRPMQVVDVESFMLSSSRSLTSSAQRPSSGCLQSSILTATYLGSVFLTYPSKYNKGIGLKIRGGGRNVDDQNVDRPKISERRNSLFS